MPPMPVLVAEEDEAASSSPKAERKPTAYPGENLPDPEPVPG